LDLLQERKTQLRTHGIQIFRPWIFLITDGGPTDANSVWWQQAVQRIREGERNQSFVFFAVGVKGADMTRLSELTERKYSLDGLRFRDLFAWLSASQKVVSASAPGTKLALPKPDWIEITI
jgi:uncharacterized protein YegL